ncbi:hypothetical protein EKO04_005676 [Ascochyta lentis]|uniref:N-acetyltransferase domain-containing protein n=1 Tax=Ascochyta lentis TaxID=205686 RepID=A0A8H7MIK5_9PLEO|nr:hypothetical protein EKO04_005676 [Ascochyta lentis]
MIDPTFHIATPRLYLSPLDPSNESHMDYYERLKNSPEILAVEAQSGAKPRAEPLTKSAARLVLEGNMDRLEKTGTGRYIISLRNRDLTFTEQPPSEREYIGTVSMQLQRYPEIVCPSIPDVGFALLSAYYGRGYASEACTALMRYFNETKGMERFAGFTHPENVASQKLFARLGFENRGVRDVVGVLGGDGAAVRVAVWVKGVPEDVDLASLNIGSRAGGSVVG